MTKRRNDNKEKTEGNRKIMILNNSIAKVVIKSRYALIFKCTEPKLKSYRGIKTASIDFF